VRGATLGILAVCVALSGCGGDEPVAAKGPAAKKAAADPGLAKKKRAEIEEKVKTISNALLNDPFSYDRTTGDAEKYELEAKEHGLGDLAEKLASVKKRARDEFETAAEKETAKAIDEARAYAVAGEMKKARNRLNGLPKNVQKEDRFWSKALAMLDEVSKMERAERYYERVTKAKLEQFKRYEDWERAQGLLEGFLAIPSFKASPRSKEVEAALADVKPQAEKLRSARASEQTIKWIPAFNGGEKDLFQWDLSEPQALSVADKVLKFKYEGDEGTGASMKFGEEAWEDYVVDIALKVEKGPLFINFHGMLEEGERNWQQGAKFDAIDFPEKDRYYKIRIEARGGDLRWTQPGMSSPITKKLKNPKGPFEIRVLRGSKVEIKSVWVKVLKTAS
jgi:hypothetical protein